jgi:hypothetical protein
MRPCAGAAHGGKTSTFIDGLFNVEFRPTNNLHGAHPFTRVQIGAVETSDPATAEKFHQATSAAVQEVWKLIAEVRDQYRDMPEGQAVTKLDGLLREAKEQLRHKRTRLTEAEARVSSSAFDGSLSLDQQAMVGPLQSAVTQAQMAVDQIQQHLTQAREKYLGLVKEAVESVRRKVLADCSARRVPVQEEIAKVILDTAIEQATIQAIETRFGHFWYPEDVFKNQ